MTSSAQQLVGAVIRDDDDDMLAMTALLFSTQREPITQLQYNHPNEINLERQIDFIVVGSLAMIAGVVIHYRRSAKPIPQIVHLAAPDALAKVGDYSSRFPYVPITPIPQAHLDKLDVTLKFEAFGYFIADLRERLRGNPEDSA